MDIENIFTYHAPTQSQLVGYQNIREAAKILANAIINNTPAGADQTSAIRKVREAVFTANAGIALEGKL
jgi:hypothetical protein